MGRDCLLLISAAGARAWTQQRGGLAPGPHFAADAVGHAAFSEWLSTRPAASFTLLADLAGESLRLETLPRSRGRDRTSLISRRCRQHFPDTPYTAAQPFRAPSGAPPRETVLLSALTPADALEPWLQRLAAQGSAVRSLHGMGFALALWVRRHGRRQPVLRGDFLLVSASPAGERHSYFQHGQLRFSRLIGDGEEAPLRRSEAHLYAHDLTDRRTPLTIVGVGAEDLVAAHNSGPHHEGGIPAPFQPVALHLPSPAGPDAAWLAPLHRLLSRALHPQAGHAPADLVRVFRTRRALATLGGVAAAVGVIALAGAASVALSTRPLVQHNAALAERLAVDAHTLAALQADTPATPHPPAEMRAITAELGRQRRLHAEPRQALATIAAVLDRHPQAVLHELRWERPPQDGAGPAPLRVTLRLELDGSDDRASARGAERLAADLARQPGIQLRPIPAETAPGATPAGHLRLELQFLEPA